MKAGAIGSDVVSDTKAVGKAIGSKLSDAVGLFSTE